MPAYTRDPRTLRGVRPNALAVRPDYTTSSAHREAVPTGRWVILSLQDLDQHLRRQGFLRHALQPYSGYFAYVYRNRSEAMEAARHAVRCLTLTLTLTPTVRLNVTPTAPSVIFPASSWPLEDRAPCTCGQMHKDPSHRCLVHPDVRPRTFDERMAFEQAWDRRVQDDREASAELKAAAAMDRQMLMGEDLPVRHSYTPRHMGSIQ